MQKRCKQHDSLLREQATDAEQESVDRESPYKNRRLFSPLPSEDYMSENPEPPIAIMNRWKEGWTSTLIKTCLLTIVLLICLILLFTLGSLHEITQNFQNYRCNPLFMPFAGNFGLDSKENFNFCLTNIFNTKAAEVFAPIYNLLGGFSDIVKLVVDVALGIRKLFSNFLFGVNNFMRSVRDRIQNIMFSIRMSFLRLNNLMGRVYGTMYAVIWMGTSAMTAGFNLADNDLVRFLFEFCFHPDTAIERKDGTFTKIADLKLGDKLAAIGEKYPKVTSIFRFYGGNTSMVRIDDVILSSQHYVVGENDAWMPAGSHPSASITSSLPELVCINVSGNVFKAGTQLIVADYDEHEKLEVMWASQRLAMMTLNGANHETDTTNNYSLGIDGSFFVRMVDNSWKLIRDIRIGDTIWNAGKVLGTVCEQCPSIVVKHGNIFAEAQIVYDPASKQWIRAGKLWPELLKAHTSDLYSLITSNCGSIQISSSDAKDYFVRDYREVPVAEMEDAYEDAFNTSRITKARL